MILRLKGQIPSGKNAIQLRAVKTKTGKNFIMKYPNKRFIAWRKEAMEQLMPQLKGIEETLPIDCSCNVVIDYTSADLRRRDAPGMIDALWHLLEQLGVVTDDKHLGGHGKQVLFRNHGKDKDNAGVEILIEKAI